MGRFNIQLLLEDDRSSTRYSIPKNSHIVIYQMIGL